MGILNLTPDSFYAESRTGQSELLSKATKMIADGADILDLGAYSSRPGADDIPEEEEINRLIPAIEMIREHYPDIDISADTFRSGVAEKAALAGATMINDISGGELDADMFDCVAELKLPYIMMHMRGNPQNMTKMNAYDDMIPEIKSYFNSKLNRLDQLGVKQVILDPGFGFAKNIQQNFELLNALDEFLDLGRDLLVGVSRKSFLYKTLGTGPEGALNATTWANSIALQKGASILRVHDVKEAKELANLFTFMRKSNHYAE